MNEPEELAVGSGRSRKRIWLRRVLRLAGVLIVLAVVVCLFWLRGALYHRFVAFPREEAAWRAIEAVEAAGGDRQRVPAGDVEAGHRHHLRPRLHPLLE